MRVLDIPPLSQHSSPPPPNITPPPLFRRPGIPQSEPLASIIGFAFGNSMRRSSKEPPCKFAIIWLTGPHTLALIPAHFP